MAADKQQTRCLVVGGAGFVGQHVVQHLLDTKRYAVRVFDIRPCELPGVDMVAGDLRKVEDVLKAVQGMEVVIHVATAAPTGANATNRELMDAVNVKGLYNVIEACKHHGVTRLVYTSSSSVLFSGSDLHFVDEAAPYAAKPMDYYTATKIEGEKLALGANGPKLAVCALRPAGIFGEGDTVFVPETVRNGKAGRLRCMIGDGTNKCDFTYVGNVAHAHVLAADKLALGSPLAGQAYNITNRAPVPMWGMLGDVLEGLGYDRPRYRLPAGLLLALAMLFEYVIKPAVSVFKPISTDFTVNRMKLVTRTRTFSCDKAARDLGYAPRVSMQEGLARTLKHFEHLRATEKPPAPGGAAKGRGVAKGAAVKRSKAR